MVAETQEAILNHGWKPHAEDDRAWFPDPLEHHISPELTILGLVFYRKEINFYLGCCILLYFPKYSFLAVLFWYNWYTKTAHI